MHLTPVAPENANEVANLLIQSFFKDEPLGIALGLSPSEASRWLGQYVSAAVKDGASMMAVDPETSNIVGVAVNVLKGEGRVFAGMDSYLDNEKEPVMGEVARFLESLEDGAQLHSLFHEQLSLVTLFLNVDGRWAGKGIASRLAKASEDRAKEIGASLLQVDTTSEFSYRVYAKAGYRVVHEVTVSEFPFNHPLSIDLLGPHKVARVLVKELQ